MSIYSIVVFISINKLNSGTMFITVIYKSEEKE